MGFVWYRAGGKYAEYTGNDETCAVGVRFKHEGKILTVYFPDPKAVLSVAFKHSGHELVT